MTNKFKKLGRVNDLSGILPDFTEADELAYSFMLSIKPGLIEYQGKVEENEQALKEETKNLDLLGQNLKKVQSDFNSVKSQLDKQEEKQTNIEKNLSLHEDKPWNFFRWLYMLLFGKKWRADLYAYENNLKEISTTIDELKIKESNLVDSQKEIEQKLVEAKETLTELEEEKNRLESVPKIVDGIGTIDYPLMPVTLKPAEKKKGEFKPGVAVLVDPSATKKRKLELPDFEIKKDDLNDAHNIIGTFSEEISLIPVNGDAENKFSKINEIIGTENNLKKAFEILTELATNYRPKEFELPIIDKDSALGNFIANKTESEDELESVSINFTVQQEQNLERLLLETDVATKILDTNARVGIEVDETVDFVLDKLIKKDANEENFIQRTDKYREKFKQQDEKLLHNHHLSSELVRYHFFCPKCNLSPSFLKKQFDVNLEKSMNINSRQTSILIDKIKSYHKVELNSKRGRNLGSDTLSLIKSSFQKYYSQLRAIAGKFELMQKDLQEKNEAEFEERQLRNLEREYKEKVRRLIGEPFNPIDMENEDSESALSWSNQIKQFNQNTRLKFNPDSEIWNCEICQEKFDMDEARMGAVDKIRYDIQIPLLNTLWSESSLWDKTITSLTSASSEIRERRVQEAESLQSPIDQFLADSRSIRSSLQANIAKNSASQLRLQQLKDDFVALGILEEKDVAQLDKTITESTKNLKVVDDELKEINVKEQTMQEIPNKIVYERVTPLAPIQQIGNELKQRLLFANHQSKDDNSQSDEVNSSNMLGE